MKKITISKVLEESRFTSLHLTVLLWCMFLLLFDGYDLTVYGSVIPSLAKEWGTGSGTLGLIGSLTLAGGLCGSFICGTAADKAGRKKVIICSTAIFGFFTLMTGIAQGPVDFAVYRFAAGLGLGGIPPLLVALTTEYSPRRIRNLMVGIMFSGYSLGGILVAFCGMKIIPLYGWEGMFYIGAIPLLAVPFLIKYLPDSLYYYVKNGEHRRAGEVLSRLNPSYSYEEEDQYIIGEEAREAPAAELFINRKGRSTIMFWTACFMGLLMVYGLSTWLPQLMMNAGFELNSSLLFLLCLNLGAILGSITGGKLADRLGSKKILITLYSCGGICLILLGFQPNSYILYGLTAVAGAATIGSQNLNNAYIASFYPTRIKSTALGWALGIGRTGAIAGPALGGILLELDLPVYISFMTFAVPAVIAAAAVSLIQNQYSSSRVESDESKPFEMEFASDGMHR